MADTRVLSWNHKQPAPSDSTYAVRSTCRVRAIFWNIGGVWVGLRGCYWSSNTIDPMFSDSACSEKQDAWDCLRSSEILSSSLTDICNPCLSSSYGTILNSFVWQHILPVVGVQRPFSELGIFFSVNWWAVFDYFLKCGALLCICTWTGLVPCFRAAFVRTPPAADFNE